uniref:TPS4 n=1 Tax=Arundo donax TaxID=35708 RepID=A0A0A9BB65_ARUDO
MEKKYLMKQSLLLDSAFKISLKIQNLHSQWRCVLPFVHLFLEGLEY